MIDLQHFICEKPSLIFNRAAIPYMIRNGYYLKGVLHNFLSEFHAITFFPYDKFSPFKLGLVNNHGDIDEYEVNRCYTLDGDRHIDLFILVECGQCCLCRYKKYTQMVGRCYAESQVQTYVPLFVTLTYRDQFLPSNGVSKDDCQRFLKRLRHILGPFRYLLVSEYGKKTKRPHYHAILFGIPINPQIPEDVERVHFAVCRAWSADMRRRDTWKLPRESRLMRLRTQLGIVDLKLCDNNGFKYVCKYFFKPSPVPKNYERNFKLFSRRPGLGCAFALNYIRPAMLRAPQSAVGYCSNLDGKLQEFFPSGYLLNKALPSLSQSFKVELRRAMDNINYDRHFLASIGFTGLKAIDERYKFLEKKYDFAPFWFKFEDFTIATPEKYLFSLYDMSTVKLPFLPPSPNYDHKRVVRLSSDVQERLERLKQNLHMLADMSDTDISLFRRLAQCRRMYTDWLSIQPRKNKSQLMQQISREAVLFESQKKF